MEKLLRCLIEIVFWLVMLAIGGFVFVVSILALLIGLLIIWPCEWMFFKIASGNEYEYISWSPSEYLDGIMFLFAGAFTVLIVLPYEWITKRLA